MDFLQLLAQKSSRARQRRAKMQEERRAEDEARCQQWLQEQIVNFKEHCVQQSERGRTNGKLFLADGKLPRALRESGRQMLQQALVDLGFEKVEVKEILADKWQGSGVFGGLLFTCQTCVMAQWSCSMPDCSPEPAQLAGGMRDVCAICAELQPLAALVPCGHLMCHECHAKRQTQRCPFCRQVVRGITQGIFMP